MNLLHLSEDNFIFIAKLCSTFLFIFNEKHVNNHLFYIWQLSISISYDVGVTRRKYEIKISIQKVASKRLELRQKSRRSPLLLEKKKKDGFNIFSQVEKHLIFYEKYKKDLGA